MPRAVLDTSVIFAASYPRDEKHEGALPILHGINDGSLPEAVVLDFVLAETLNGMIRNVGHDAAVDLLDRIEENAWFHIASLGKDCLATAKAQFRKHDTFSFVDACIVAYMQTEGLEYLYAFDGDFDRADDVRRLETAANPYEPK